MGFELVTLVTIGNDCTVSCKSNYPTITTMLAPLLVDYFYERFCKILYDEGLTTLSTIFQSYHHSGHIVLFVDETCVADENQ